MRYLKLPAPFQDYFQTNPYHETIDCTAVFLHALTHELNTLFADPTADPRVIERCLRTLLVQQHLDGFDAVPLPDFLKLLHQPHWIQETPELILDVIRELKVLAWREVPDTWLELEEKYTREGAEVLPPPHAADWWEFA